MIDVALMWVEYSGDIELKSDPTPSQASFTYLDEHWIADGGDPDSDPDREYPFAYPRNTKLQISAEWNLTPSTVPASFIEVKANGTGSLDFDWTGTSDTTDGVEITSKLTTGNTPSVVDYIPGFNIVWSIRFNGGTSCDAGKNYNPLYVPLDTPESGAEKFLSVAYIGCREAAGENTESGVFDEIWTEFANRSVYKKGGAAAMKYYEDWEVQYYTTEELLKHEDGQCDAWVRLMIDCLKFQGSDDFRLAQVESLYPREVLVTHDWSFGTGTSGDINYPWWNVPEEFPLEFDNEQYYWIYAEVTAISGQNAQGNNDPRALFGNHKVVERKSTSKLYCPSYGLPFDNLLDLDETLFQGYMLPVTPPSGVNEADFGTAGGEDLNGNMSTTDTGVMVDVMYFRKNAVSMQDLKITFE